MSFPGLTRIGSPTWSPDDARIGFSALAAGRRNVYTALADGSDPRRLTTLGGSAPAWSARNEIAFVRDGNIRVMARGHAQAPGALLPGDKPTWAPGGLALAFAATSGSRGDRRKVTSVLYRVDLRGRGLLRLTTRRSEDPAWTPDGRRVMFTRSDGFNLRILSVGAPPRPRRAAGHRGHRGASCGRVSQPTSSRLR